MIKVKTLGENVRTFKVYYLGRLRSPDYDDKKRFFKITWEDEKPEKEVSEEITEKVPEKNTKVKNYLIFTREDIKIDNFQVTITEDRVISCNSNSGVNRRELTLIPPFNNNGEEFPVEQSPVEQIKKICGSIPKNVAQKKLIILTLNMHGNTLDIAKGIPPINLYINK